MLHAPTLANVLAKQLQIGKAAEELAKLDQRACPVCGITFYEFRNQGRLGCAHDYVCFQKELEPLMFSTDPNFRPVGIMFGPDGALYVVDWFNPLIGHMQHSIRDPGRDQALWQAVRELPERQAQVVVLHYVDDRLVAEIAELLDCSEGTVKTHLHRARLALARILAPSSEEDDR